MEGSDPFKKRGNTAGTTVKIMHRNCWIGMSHVPGDNFALPFVSCETKESPLTRNTLTLVTCWYSKAYNKKRYNIWKIAFLSTVIGFVGSLREFVRWQAMKSVYTWQSRLKDYIRTFFFATCWIRIKWFTYNTWKGIYKQTVRCINYELYRRLQLGYFLFNDSFHAHLQHQSN